MLDRVEHESFGAVAMFSTHKLGNVNVKRLVTLCANIASIDLKTRYGHSSGCFMRAIVLRISHDYGLSFTTNIRIFVDVYLVRCPNDNASRFIDVSTSTVVVLTYNWCKCIFSSASKRNNRYKLVYECYFVETKTCSV